MEAVVLVVLRRRAGNVGRSYSRSAEEGWPMAMEAVVLVVLWRRTGHGGRSYSRTVEEGWTWKP